MQFTTPLFAVFFCFAILLWWSVNWSSNTRTSLLALFNATFYLACGIEFFLVLIGVITWCWGMASFWDRGQPMKQGRWWLVSVSVLLCHLVVWKYWPWLSVEYNALAATQGGALLDIPEWVAPLGLSFMTFHAINWLHAVRSGNECRRGWVAAMAHIGFFPTLMAGPVLEAGQVGGKLIQSAPWGCPAWLDGVNKIALGMVFKWVLASQASSQSSHAFDSSATGAFEIWWGVHAYAFEIFFDFAGYSLIALGLAQMLGFDLTENFKQPYLATSLQDFWRRWHRSLSFFFRDRVYIGLLGGNSRGPHMASLAAAMTLFISGVWHGAALTFVIWGTWHAVGYLLERYLSKVFHWPYWLGWLMTFQWVVWGWVWFKAKDIGQALDIFSMAWGAWGDWAPSEIDWVWMISLAVVIWVEGALLQFVTKMSSSLDNASASWYGQVSWGLGLGAVSVLAMWLGPQGVPAFIYSGF